MILKKLYITPSNKFFKPIKFKMGFNFIFGKKEFSEDPKETLNGIGKSTLLELIDFALLAKFNKNDGKRLHKAWSKGILKGASVVLEFEVDKAPYKIIRSFDKNKNIIFIKEDGVEVKYDIEDLKPVLCDTIFERPEYLGYYSNAWFRRLMPLFIKIQSNKDHKFEDPIIYFKRGREVELMQYHLFFMDIDNTLSNMNFIVQQQLKEIKPAINGINKFLLNEFSLKKIGDAENSISNLKMQIESLQKSIDLFQLSKQYKVEESKADELTASIKELWFQNNADRQKIEQYLISFNHQTGVNTNKVRTLYAEFNELLADKLKKSLDEVITFRKELSKSRKEFLTSEISKLKDSIQQREKQITEMELERGEVYKFLSAQNAIKDLQEAYHSLNKLKDEASDLDSKIRSHRELSIKKINFEQEEKSIEASLMKFKEQISQLQYIFARFVSELYNTLYADIKGPSEFVIENKFNSIAKLHLNILESNKMLSTGRNQGRTLIYDLSIMFHAIARNIKLPRFIIHDGIFSEMDKSHLIELYKYIQAKEDEGLEFQYILTLNEEGHLSNNFGDGDLLDPFKIAEEAIKVLTPKETLLGDF